MNSHQSDHVVSGRRGGAWLAKPLPMALSALTLIAGMAGLLWPLLSYPVTADERYQYLWIPALMPDLWANITGSLNQIPSFALQGRISPLAFIQQRIAYDGVTDLAVASGVDVYVIHGFMKLMLLLLCLAALWWVLRVVRVSDAEGEPTPLSTWTSARIMLLASVLTVAGVGLHDGYRNAWTAYPILTYTIVPIALVAAALVLMGINAAARRSWLLWPILAACVVWGLSVALNYEVMYIAGPVAAVAGLWQATTGSAVQRWRRRVAVTAALVVPMAIAVVGIRVHLARVCAENTCYVGVQPSYGARMFRAWAVNLMSGAPIFGGDEAHMELTRSGADLVVAGPGANGGWFWALLVIAGGVGLWWGLRCRIGPDSSGHAADASSWRAGWLLFAMGVVGALGAALLMSVSGQAQQLMTSPGKPYRATVFIWFCYVMAMIGVVLLASALKGRPWLRRTAWGLPLFTVLWAGIFAFPVNSSMGPIARQHRFQHVTDRMHSAITFTDPGPLGDAGRCRLVDEMWMVPRVGSDEKKRVIGGATAAHRHYWGIPFCSTLDKNLTTPNYRGKP